MNIFNTETVYQKWIVFYVIIFHKMQIIIFSYRFVRFYLLYHFRKYLIANQLQTISSKIIQAKIHMNIAFPRITWIIKMDFIILLFLAKGAKLLYSFMLVSITKKVSCQKVTFMTFWTALTISILLADKYLPAKYQTKQLLYFTVTDRLYPLSLWSRSTAVTTYVYVFPGSAVSSKYVCFLSVFLTVAKILAASSMEPRLLPSKR